MLRVVSGGLDRLPAGDVTGPVARGRTLILIAAVLAAGLVYVNVGAVEAGDGFGKYSQRATELQRQNTQLRARIAQLGSTERIQKQASALGLEMPAPEQFTFVRADGGDPLRAMRTYTVPAPKPAAPLPGGPSTQTGATGVGQLVTTPQVSPAPTATAPTQTTAPESVPGGGAGAPSPGANPAPGGN